MIRPHISVALVCEKTDLGELIEFLRLVTLFLHVSIRVLTLIHVFRSNVVNDLLVLCRINKMFQSEKSKKAASESHKNVSAAEGGPADEGEKS